MSDTLETVRIHDADARIQFDVPTSWKRVATKHNDTSGLRLIAPDESASMDFVFISKGVPETVAEEKATLDALDKIITDVRVTAPAAHAMQHGLRVFGMAGEGDLQRAPIHWYSIAYGDGLGHGVLVTVLIKSATLAVNKPVTDKVAVSIAPYVPPAA